VLEHGARQAQPRHQMNDNDGDFFRWEHMTLQMGVG